jgi:hypothetical protein
LLIDEALQKKTFSLPPMKKVHRAVAVFDLVGIKFARSNSMGMAAAAAVQRGKVIEPVVKRKPPLPKMRLPTAPSHFPIEASPQTG